MKFFMKKNMKKNKDEGHSVVINIPKNIINNAIKEEFIKISKTENINGFRKGKIPIKFIQKKYGDSVYYDIFKQLMQKFFHEFITKEKIIIIGSPKYYIHKNNDKKKETFEYSVIYEVYPKFYINRIKNIKVKKINIQIKNEDIQQNIMQYQFKKFIWKKINRPIKFDDRVTINYCIYKNMNLITSFNEKNFTFIPSDNKLIPQLKYKILNHVINDVFFFTIKCHELYPEKELQNQYITFKIKIVNIEEKEEKEINIKNTNNVTNKSNQINYVNIKNNINLKLDQITEKYLEDQIIEQIIEKNIISIPPIVLKQQKKTIYEKYLQQYQKENCNILEQKYHCNIDIQAKKILCMQIIVDNIISDNKIFVDEKNIKYLLNNIAVNYNKPEEIINLYNNNDAFKKNIKNIELKNQAMILLKKNINIVQKYWTFDYFLQHQWEIYNEFY